MDTAFFRCRQKTQIFYIRSTLMSTASLFFSHISDKILLYLYSINLYDTLWNVPFMLHDIIIHLYKSSSSIIYNTCLENLSFFLYLPNWHFHDFPIMILKILFIFIFQLSSFTKWSRIWKWILNKSFQSRLNFIKS